MKNEKAFQKNQLIYEFGILIQPFEDLARAAQPPSLNDYRIATAKVHAGDDSWRQQVRNFTIFAPDILFNQEYQDISHVPERCRGALRSIINDPDLHNDIAGIHRRFQQELARARENFFQLIDRVPVKWEPIVFEANTPFTSYLRIKEAIIAVKRRLHYFDRYLKPDFYTLFLASVPADVSIRLVTTTGDARYGVTAVSAISNLAEQQFSDYRLIEVKPSEIHDRNLRVDDLIFTLGPGVDRAGIALTNFGPSDSSEGTHHEFDRIIAEGRVV